MAANKRTQTQRARDGAIIARLHGEGLTDREITEELNRRPGVDYQLSRRQVSLDRESLERQWLSKSEHLIDSFIAESIARLDAVEQEAWQAWFASMEDEESEQLKEELLRDGDGIPLNGNHDLELTERVLTRKGKVGDAKFLDIILKCIKQRDGLRNLNKVNLTIEQRTTHKIKTIRGWMPEERWGERPSLPSPAEAVDGKYVEMGDE